MLLGRQREIEKLERLLSDVARGRGRSCVLYGEPGIGKTRLAGAAEELAAARGFAVGWGRALETGGAPHRAELAKGEALTLDPGQSTYWLGPPHDIHSQETLDREVWELVLTGRNVLAEGVTRHRHYFDPETGKITGSAPP